MRIKSEVEQISERRLKLKELIEFTERRIVKNRNLHKSKMNSFFRFLIFTSLEEIDDNHKQLIDTLYILNESLDELNNN